MIDLSVIVPARNAPGLTQLCLGIDRDSEILAAEFDERDPGVKRMIEAVVAAAHRKRRKDRRNPDSLSPASNPKTNLRPA